MVGLPKNFSKRILQRSPLNSDDRLRAYKSFCGLALALSLVIAGCATSPDETATTEREPAATPDVVTVPKTEPPVAEPTEKPPTAAQPDGQADIKQPDADAMVTVSVYTIDDQCNGFVEETMQVHSDQAIAEAVGKAMTSVDYNAFKLEGYEVNINGTTAIVDMKLAPSSERQFVSLSSCEQRSLFGSIEETLLNNSDWNVEAVKFTTDGKELVL
ncbi:MAG: sporulation/spore germination protein [Phormidesmis sp. RL_2_1]|nr:sporulation/spore germination protein [Phormidesmis sp. RL_2_1]